MYGLDKNIKKFIDEKIEKNKSFLKNLTFYDENYNLVSMFDNDLNANLSPERYFAEVANRVNTLFAVSRELDLVPAFLTITLPSDFHPSGKNYNGFSPRESALYLSDIWSKFLRLKIFEHIKNSSGHNMVYIRVYEPHKSGVPHLHAMIFVPRDFLERVKFKFFDYLKKKGFKKVGLKFITNFSHARYEEAAGAIAYILKYMNKTFKSAKDNKMTNEAYYFAYHGIRRFITSQTLIPLWIYRKIKHNEDSRDLYSLTKKYRNGLIVSQFNKEFIIEKKIKKEVVFYDDEESETVLSVEDEVLYQKNHFISEQFKNNIIHYEDVPKTWKNSKKLIKIPIFTDGKLTHYYKDGEIVLYRKHISLMSDLELYEYHNAYDVEKDDYTHYLAVKNLMISRGLLHIEKYDLNKFDFNEFLF